MNLYKYFSEEGLLRFLQSFEVRFSPPYVFNDPFEGRPRLGLEGEWEQLAEQEQRIPRRSKKSTRRLPHRTDHRRSRGALVGGNEPTVRVLSTVSSGTFGMV